MKDKERSRNFHREEETMETQYLNVMLRARLDSKSEKGC